MNSITSIKLPIVSPSGVDGGSGRPVEIAGAAQGSVWSDSYYWMVKTQDGIAYYFLAQGRPVKVSGYYEEKMREEEKRDRQKAMERYHRDTAWARQQWERYLEKHPAAPVAFEWKSLLETPPGQKLAKVFNGNFNEDIAYNKSVVYN